MAGVKAFSLGSGVELRRVLLLRGVRLKLLVSELSHARRLLLDAKVVFRLGTDLRIRFVLHEGLISIAHTVLG